MKIVFVGAGAVFGYHSQQFCRAAPKGSEFYVVEPYDENARLAKMPRLSLEEAATIADLAIIMTPSHVRWEVVSPFFQQRKPVVIEKPLTIHWDEIILFEEAVKSGWFCCPILNIRQVKKVETIKEAVVNSSSLPTDMFSWKTRYRPGEYYDDWHGKWATDGGVLAQQGFHCLDLVCWLGGEPVAVSARGENRKHQIECEDTASVEVLFKNGVRGKVECTTAAAPNEHEAGLRVVVNGETLETRGGMFAGGTPGHTILARRIFAALANKEGPPITVASVVPSLYALHAAYVSMQHGGEWVSIGTRSKLGGQSDVESK